MKRKLFLIFNYIILITAVIFFNISHAYAKEINIDEVLNGKGYSSLSPIVKKFIKDYYEENKVVLLTKDLASDGQAYLNPSYIEYLESESKEGYYVIPSITSYTPNYEKKSSSLTDFKNRGIITSNKSKNIAESEPILPSKFDLRNVNGKNFVTPNKNQGNEGLCWAYATASLLETHDLITKNKSYDSSAILFSEKQMDYALSSDGIVGGNNVVKTSRKLLSGGSLDESKILLAERLSGFQDTWNVENKSAISKNEKLEPYIVFNREKALYEVDDTLLLTNINENPDDEEYNNAMVTAIKRIAYNNGGVTVNIKSSSSNMIRNINGDYLAITSLKYFTKNVGQHALHLIGWDDDYEYTFCSADDGGKNGKFVSDNDYYHADHECGRYGSAGNYKDYVKVSGRGAWILKNSWGDDYSFVYLPYDSFIDDIFAITNYSDTKNWDNSEVIKHEIVYNNTTHSNQYIYNLDGDLLNGNSIVKLKVKTNAPTDIALYYSENGNDSNLTLVDNYSFDYKGIHTIDLSEKNLHVGSNSYFQIDSYYEVIVFTKNNDNVIKASTSDFTYGIVDDTPTSERFLNILVNSKLRNIDDNKDINYKIKKNGEYLPTNAYSIMVNKSYYGIATPIIKLSEQYAKKGEYVLETWKDNNLLCSSSINLEVDYESINGDGTNDNPWQITNNRQLNMVRNKPNDNYILMNDLDLEYDTQNKNGLFYNNGNGWRGISNFGGNFNGNNKTIKNIKTPSGLFWSVSIYGSECQFDECGIHDLKVDNLNYTVKNYGQSSGNGGIVNMIYIHSGYKFNFNNLSVTNATFIYNENVMPKIKDIEVRVGGIAGEVMIYGSQSFTATILNVNNWYSNYTLNATSYQNYQTINHIGGLIGEVKIYNGPFLYFYINNAKVNSSINISNDNDTNYYVSDLVGTFISNYSNVDFKINNTIGNVDYHYNDNSLVTTNAFICNILENNIGSVKVNGSKSTLNYVNNDFITITNSNYSLKPYQIARLNYNDINYYKSQYYIYNQYRDDTTKVEFKDMFDVYDNMIPTLKKFPENYSEYYDSITMKVGQEKDITDLIKNDTNYRNLKVLKSFQCDLDICNYVTDETIITVPTEENNYSFRGLKAGITTLIIYDELSGYLDKVIVNVLGENDYILSFDYNYNNLKGDSRIITKNSPYGDLPVLNRDGFEFLGWFTEKNGGTKIKESTIFTGNADITLYAHWQEVMANYTVTFNSNGGSSVASQTIDYNGKATKPSNPTKTGYTFKEWQLNGSTYDFNTAVTSNITLIAVWEKNEVIDVGTVTLKNTLENNGYSVNGNLTSRFTLGESIATIKNKLGNDVIIETNNSIISTGTVIKKGSESYTVVIKGDLTGDGKVNSGDLLQMRKYLLEEVNLTGAYKEAGIIESNGEIKSLDLLRLRQYLLGEYEFR